MSVPKEYYLKFLDVGNHGPYSWYKFPGNIKPGWKTPRIRKKIAMCSVGWHFTDLKNSNRWLRKKKYVVKPLGIMAWQQNKGVTSRLEFIGQIYEINESSILKCIKKYEKLKKAGKLWKA